jgi:hypothetical protein
MLDPVTRAATVRVGTVEVAPGTRAVLDHPGGDH